MTPTYPRCNHSPSFRTIAAALFACAATHAAPIVTTPAGLAPGTQYQLVFVTSDAFLATSTGISTYNSDVASEAALNSTLAAFDSANGVTWTVIGSTQTVNADVNAPSSGLVYNLAGIEVASSTSLLYSGALLAAIDINQNGVTESTGVWTGSTTAGTAAGGINDLGQTFPEFGDSALTTGGWISDGNGTESDNDAPLYALSSVITVEGSVPEPATWTLLPGALLVLAGLSRRRKANASREK
jgi:hypothetical protein